MSMAHLEHLPHKCTACSPPKVLRTAIRRSSPFRSNRVNRSSTDLKYSSYNFIWEYFINRSSFDPIPDQTIPFDNNLYNKLVSFAKLSFQSTKTTLYQLYLITRPIDTEDPDYFLLKSYSIATLITLLWTILKSHSSATISEEHFISMAKDKYLTEIEKDIEWLIDGSPTSADWNKILLSYGFKPADYRSLPSYQEIFTDSRSIVFGPSSGDIISEFDGTITEGDGAPSGQSPDGKYIYDKLVDLTYHWPTILKVIYLKGNVFHFKPTSLYHLQGDGVPPTGGRWYNYLIESVPFLFQTAMKDDNLLPNIELDGYSYSDSLKYIIHKWIIAENVLRKFTWLFIRVLFLSDHHLLVTSLSFQQLTKIYQANSICDIITIPDESPAWTTFVTNIGDILISRAVKELSGCKYEERFNLLIPSQNLSKKYLVEEDLEKDLLRKWYNYDRNYALVALANSIRYDGSVDICSLNVQVTSRIRRGILKPIHSKSSETPKLLQGSSRNKI